MPINATTLLGAKTVDGSIKNLVNRDDIPVAIILTEAQALIWETLRVREMMTQAPITFLTGGNEVDLQALDARFQAPIEFVPYGWGSALPYVLETSLNAWRDDDGNLETGESPSRWTIKGTIAYVDIELSADFPGILDWYTMPEELEETNNETNFLTVRYPSLLISACLAKAFRHMKQTDAMVAELQMTQALIRQANASNEEYRERMQT